MGFLDDAKKQLTKAVDDHGDKIRDGLDKAGDVADKKTKGKYTDQIAKGKTAATGALDKLDGKKDDFAEERPRPSPPPRPPSKPGPGVSDPGTPTDPTGPTG